MLVWDYLYGDLPPKLKTYFVLNKEVHQHNLRSEDCNNLYVNHSKTVAYGINSIKHQCIRSWNNLPGKLKSETSLKQLKTKLVSSLKQICIDNYL